MKRISTRKTHLNPDGSTVHFGETKNGKQGFVAHTGGLGLKNIPQDGCGLSEATVLSDSSNQEVLPFDLVESEGRLGSQGVGAGTMLTSLGDEQEPEELPVGAIGQIPMLMTALEIKNSHQALLADRHYPFEGGFDPSLDTENRQTSPWSDAPFLETDRELFNRKAEEAKQHGLAVELEEDNYVVVNPIQLKAPRGFEDYQINENQRGTTNDSRPEILHGHHRIAVLSEKAPEVLMPVEFFKNLREARESSKKSQKT